MRAPVLLAPVFLEDEDFRASGLVEHGGGDRSAGDRRGTDGLAFPATYREHIVEDDRLAGLAAELLDQYNIIFGDPVLLAAGANHCEHRFYH